MDEKPLVKVWENKAPETRDLPVGECTTNKKSNYADQAEPKEINRNG